MMNLFGFGGDNCCLYILILLLVLCVCKNGCLSDILDKICNCGCLLPILLVLLCCSQDKDPCKPRYGIGCVK